jgi:hypothetical protein
MFIHTMTTAYLDRFFIAPTVNFCGFDARRV